jgi:hypothetical protein
MDDFCEEAKELINDIQSPDAISDVASLQSRVTARNAKRAKLRARANEGSYEDLIAILDHDAIMLSPDIDAKLGKAIKKALKALQAAAAAPAPAAATPSKKGKGDEKEEGAASAAPYRRVSFGTLSSNNLPRRYDSWRR